MTAAENSIVESAVQRLKTGLNPLRIYLFGSRAGGGALPDSDYDLMTVVDHSDLPRYKRAQQARRLPPLMLLSSPSKSGRNKSDRVFPCQIRLLMKED